jgi:four helix bundle protein
MGNFRNLRVWRAAQELAIATHRIAAGMRGPTSMTLRDQLTRAAMSVPANIVEGSAHSSSREFARFLSYAIASVSETESHAQLGCDLGLIAQSDFDNLLNRIVDVRMMLHGLLKKLRAS